MKTYFLSQGAWDWLGGSHNASAKVNAEYINWIKQKLVIRDQSLLELANKRGDRTVDPIVWKACFGGREKHTMVLTQTAEEALAAWYVAQGGPRHLYKCTNTALTASAIELIARGWVDGF